MPTASLQNASGAFVKPTTDSLLAGIKHSKVNADGVTRSVDLASKDKAIYPLTLQISAALSTKADKATREQMADFLDYVDGPGQVPGDEVGRLPNGHAPLTPAQRAQVRQARTAVLAGPADPPADGPTDGPTDQPTGGPTAAPTDQPTGGTQSVPGLPTTGPDGLPVAPPLAAPSDGTDPAADPADPTTDQASAASQLTAVASQSAGHRLMTLPGLLVIALAGLLAGPLVLWLERTGRGPQWLRR
jgi:hypothetical protein